MILRQLNELGDAFLSLLGAGSAGEWESHEFNPTLDFAKRSSYLDES